MQRLGVISAFIVLFVALVSLTTVAKPFESLAAAAAYVCLWLPFCWMFWEERPKTEINQVLSSTDGLSAHLGNKLKTMNWGRLL